MTLSTAFVVTPAALSARSSAFAAPAARSSELAIRPETRNFPAPARRRAALRASPRASASDPPPKPSNSESSAPPPPGEGGPPLPDRKVDQTFFGLRLKTNGDVLKFGVVATAIPFAIKAAIQAVGVPDLQAGQITTGFVSVFALVAWVSTYVFRVGTKNMTYAQQLREYEDQVIQKRFEELSEEELAALQEELKEDE